MVCCVQGSVVDNNKKNKERRLLFTATRNSQKLKDNNKAERNIEDGGKRKQEGKQKSGQRFEDNI
jgi:hypothetical protein